MLNYTDYMHELYVNYTDGPLFTQPLGDTVEYFGNKMYNMTGNIIQAMLIEHVGHAAVAAAAPAIHARYVLDSLIDGVSYSVAAQDSSHILNDIAWFGFVRGWTHEHIPNPYIAELFKDAIFYKDSYQPIKAIVRAFAKQVICQPLMAYIPQITQHGVSMHRLAEFVCLQGIKNALRLISPKLDLGE